MRLDNGLESWLFPVKPMEGESLSHFLGRVRRRNHLTSSALGQLAGIGTVIARWEILSLVLLWKSALNRNFYVTISITRSNVRNSRHSIYINPKL